VTGIEHSGRNPAECTLVVFGGAGDLTRRLLLPSLLNLASEGRLPDRFALVGYARTNLDDESFRERLDEAVEVHASKDLDPGLWKKLRPRVYWVRGGFDDPEGYQRLKRVLDRVGADQGTAGCTVFYLACPPRYFEEVARQLGAAGLVRNEKGCCRRLVVEKPFGRDLESARELNRHLLEVFGESQVFRIDHYLGKETVQNILAFRFANGIFEPIWNRRYVDSVQITVAESLGVEGRGNYFERAGTLRDMVPNHLFQVLTLIAMEPPSSLAADAVRDEKGKVLRSIPTLTAGQVERDAVRAQYGPGRLASGEDAPGYTQEQSVDPSSRTETYVALRLGIDSWRWAGVPFYLRTGKRLSRRASEVVVAFRRAPLQLFRDTPVSDLKSNQLVLRLQPREGIALRFELKHPGPEMKLGQVEMDFCYSEYFGETAATGYETLLWDAMRGDATLFQRADNVEEGWRVVEPVLRAWGSDGKDSLPAYTAGSEGPEAAAQLLRREGRKWKAIG
jgi:glucose-6-phosphate 1-dehydrogenase